jgi:putative transposase
VKRITSRLWLGDERQHLGAQLLVGERAERRSTEASVISVMMFTPRSGYGSPPPFDDLIAERRDQFIDGGHQFSGPFGEVFRTEGVRVIRTPIRSPKANAFAERFVKTVRHECLDHLLIFGERHLRWALREYLRHYNEERPHRGLSLETPEPGAAGNRGDGAVVRVDRLGGLIHEYRRTAA